MIDDAEAPVAPESRDASREGRGDAVARERPAAIGGRTLAAIAALAFALRALYVTRVWAHPAVRLPVIDAEAYRARALEILGGHWLGDAVYYLDPLYPFFLATVYAFVPPDSVGVLLAQALLDSLSVVLIALLAQRVFDPRTACVAGLLAATYKPFFFYDALLLKAPVMIFLMVTALFFVVRAAGGDRLRAWWPAGFFVGLAALTRGNSLLFAPALGLWILIQGAGDLRRRLLAGIVLGLGLACAIGPVTLRNYVVGDDLVLLNSQAGQNFYIGHFSGNDTGAYRAPSFLRPNPVFEEADFAREAKRRTGREMKPSEISSFWLRQGLEEIVADPMRFLRHSARKVLLLVNHYEIPDNASYAWFRHEVSDMLGWPLPAFASVLPLSVAGFLLAWRRPLAILLAAFVVSYSAGIVLFFNLSRLRLPIVPVLLVFAGFALVEGIRLARAREGRRLVLPLAAVLVLIPVTRLDLIEQNLNVRYLNMGIGFLTDSEGLWRQGSAAEEAGDTAAATTLYGRSFEQRAHAERQFRRALEHDPDYDRARRALRRSIFTRVVLLDARGRATESFEAALLLTRSFPRFSPGWVVLGTAHEKLGRPAEARRAFERALVLQPGNDEARTRLEELGDSATSP